VADPDEEKQMARVIVSEFVALDGVMEAPGGEKHPDGKNEWSTPYFSPDMGDEAFAILKQADALLLGRRSYEHFAAAWPSMTDADGFADRMNGLPKLVVTSTGDPLEWNAKPLTGDPVEQVRRLKEHGATDLLILGSGQLVHALTDAGLVDEYHVFVHPVVVGSGKRLFRDGSPLVGLRLTDARPFTGGVVALTYEPAAVGAAEAGAAAAANGPTR
jgi:dihydrofolate reductase